MIETLKGFTEAMPFLWAITVNIIIAALSLIAGWWASSLLGRWVRRAATRSPLIDQTIVPMCHTVIVWSVRVFTLIAVLAHLGVQTASFIAILGAAGLAVGLALQGTLQNIAAGIMLLLLRPLRAGEYIALSNGTEGTVQEVGLFLTGLIQADGIHITLPNSVIWNATITNYSRNATRRLELPVLVRYDNDLDTVMAKLEQIVKSHPATLSEPLPLVKVVEYKDNGVVINIRAWANADQYWDLRWDLHYQIRQTLDAAGFKPAVPVREMIQRSPHTPTA
jgi:small-conductance mechanosensitive channel